MRRVPVLMLCLVLAAPAAACLNDSSTGPAENEFNAAYAGQPHGLGRIFQPLALLLIIPPAGLVAVALWLRRNERIQHELALQLRQQRLARQRTPTMRSPG